MRMILFCSLRETNALMNTKSCLRIVSSMYDAPHLKDWIFHVFGFVSSKTMRAEASTEGNAMGRYVSY